MLLFIISIARLMIYFQIILEMLAIFLSFWLCSIGEIYKFFEFFCSFLRFSEFNSPNEASSVFCYLGFVLTVQFDESWQIRFNFFLCINLSILYFFEPCGILHVNLSNIHKFFKVFSFVKPPEFFRLWFNFGHFELSFRWCIFKEKVDRSYLILNLRSFQ